MAVRKTDAPAGKARVASVAVVITLAAVPFAAKAEENIARPDMPRYCLYEAASAYGVRREDVITLPAEPDQNMFSVYGQTPAEGANALFFICTFNGAGQFVGVDTQSDDRS